MLTIMRPIAGAGTSRPSRKGLTKGRPGKGGPSASGQAACRDLPLRLPESPLSSPALMAAGMICCRVTSVSLRSVCFSSARVSVSSLTISCSTRRLRERNVGAIGSDFAMLDPLHAGNDDEIQNGAFALPFRFRAISAARDPGSRISLLRQ